MNYRELRDQFKSGDVVFFSKGKKNIVRRLITWFTNGPHYHVGFVFWMLTDSGNSRLMLAESQPGGYRIINLSAYRDRGMTVFRCPVDWHLISERVIESAGDVPYDFLDMALVGLHEKFGTPIPNITGPGEVCSVMVSKILQGAGMTGIVTMVSPQRLCEQLTKCALPTFTIK